MKPLDKFLKKTKGKKITIMLGSYVLESYERLSKNDECSIIAYLTAGKKHFKIYQMNESRVDLDTIESPINIIRDYARELKYRNREYEIKLNFDDEGFTKIVNNALENILKK